MPEISQRAADNKLPTEELTKQMQQMALALEKYYHGLQQMQRHLIPRYLKNMGFFAANNTQITILYQSQMVVRVTSMLIVATSAATLSIGNFIQFPVVSGVLNLGIDGLLIEPGQALVMNQQNAGPLGLICMGQEMASEGLRW